MFRKVIGKKCETPGCKAVGSIVDTALNICEECAQPLAETTVVDRRKLIPALVLTAVIVIAGGYLSVLGLKRYLLGVAAKTTGEVTQVAREQIEAQIKALLRQSAATGSPAAAIEAQIDQLARQHGVSRETIAQWRAQPTPPATPIPATSIAPETAEELVKLLRQIYRDGVKTAEEQAQLDELTKRHAFPPPQLMQREQETKERLTQSEISLKQGLVYASQRNHEQAIKEFLHSTEIDPANAFAWANLCGAYLNLKQPTQAEQSCRRALSEDGENWLAHYNLGSLYAQRAQKDDAIKELSAALRIVAADRTQRITQTDVTARLKADQSFSQLRGDPRFLELLARK